MSPVTDDTSPLDAAIAGLPRVVDLLTARAEEHDRDATFPYQGIEAVHEAGLLALTVHQRYGGPGGTLADTVRVLAELGRGDASVALVTAFTLLLHAEQGRNLGWPASVYRRLLNESRRGPALVNTLWADPAEGPAAVARRDGDGWLLTGRKTGCTGAEALAWMAVRARTDEPQPRTGTFLVRGESAGVQVDPVWDQVGLRASAGHDVLFDRVSVPAEAVVDLRAEPDAEADAVGTAWRDLALAAVQLGVGRAARDWLVRFLQLGGGAPGTRSCRQAAVGELESALIGAEELLTGLAARIDAGDRQAADRTGPVHLLVTRAVVESVQQAVALAGSAGLSRRHPLERYLRDALSGRLHGPSQESVLRAAGGAALDGCRPRG
ncbi:alkylation response protein AidB-like acyl-CoA dehydrogenase [Kitasatospora sp. MAP12-15]|uniref:acyl-CoA dehydrogenase family protein n=1 Tax=unclassified Kitasatospora TaxID=2633591 RepID=UPI0024762EE0|nr:acyl-CoA dehydrogenase family protein [Kitasatospora sp. MAP12-44]MDH6109072.1 alkylation response protein AidB-like acyl-CoA dehydrogenase [Kitasatospora sp. MAP12-44]